MLPYRLLNTVRKRLFFLLLTTLVPVLLIQSYYYFNRYQARETNELRSNLEMARAVAGRFESFVHDIITTENAIGINLTTLPQSSPAEMINQILAANLSVYPSVRNFAWATPDGQVIASSLETVIGVDVRERPFFQEILAGREWTVSDLLPSKATGEPIFFVSRPVRDSKGGLVGVLMAAVLPEKLGKELAVERVKGGAITLIDRNGLAVYRYPRMHWDWEDRNWLRFYPETRKALAGEEVLTTIPGFDDGKDRMAALTPVHSLGWVAEASRPKEMVMAPVRSQILYQADLFFVLIALVFSTAFVISRSISGPVDELRRYALGLVKGERDQRVQIEHLKEVEDLASTLESMVREIGSRESEKEAILTSLREVVVAYLDPELRVIWTNAETAGVPSPPLGNREGERCFEVIHGQSEPCLGCTALLAIQTGEPQEGEITRPDGKSFIVASNPIKDPSGKVTGVVHSAVNITERKQTEEALRESEEKFRSLAESSTDYIMRYDREGRHLYVNSACARISGIPAEEFTGKTHRELGFDEKLCDVWEERIKKVFDTGEPKQWEFEFEGAEGPVYLDWRVVPEFKDGRVVGALGGSRDVTEQKKAEHELRSLSTRLLHAQEEERKRLARGLHDSIGGTLSALKYSLESVRSRMEEGETTPETLDQLIGMVQGAIGEARRIYMDLRPSILDDLGIVPTIGWFCRQYQSIYSDIRVESEITVEEEKIPEEIKIVIFRIMQEALNNAGKYSQANLVRVALSSKDGRLELTVEDNGTGFNVNTAPLRRGDKGGLGLTSMRERAELSGGAFKIESAIGEGTTVHACWDVG